MTSKRWRATWHIGSVAFVTALLALVLCPLTVHADEVDDLIAQGDYVEGEVVAAFLSNDDAIQLQSETSYEVLPIMTVNSSAVEAADGTIALQASSDEVTLSVVSSDSLTTEELLRELADDPRIAFAEPNYITSIPSYTSDGEYAISPQAGDNPFDDLTFVQWGDWTTDTTVRTIKSAENPSINVPEFGSDQIGANMEEQIVVALLDTAVNYEHPDLVNIIYRFTDEQQDALGCGAWGYNALDKGTHPDSFDPGSTAFGHGTHTAGILGAEWDGHGTSGVASNVKIVAIELAGSDGNECLVDALCAFSFINRFNEMAPEGERVRITSNSWGEHMSSRALNAAVMELGERWGIVTFFSSGNDGKNNDHYEKTPSSLADNPYAVVVGNTDLTDALDSSSEYGLSTVHLAAPGTFIFSSTTEERGQYFADATRDSNLLYVGFDDDNELPLTVSQLYEVNNPMLYQDDNVVRDDIAIPASEVHFNGSGCLMFEVDPSYSVGTHYGTMQLYDLQFDIDLSGTDIPDRLDDAKGLHVGLAMTTSDGSALGVQATTNMTAITVNDVQAGDDGEETIVSVTRPVTTNNIGSSLFSATEWGTLDFLITHESVAKEADNPEVNFDVATFRPEDDHLVIKVRVATNPGVSTIYVDSLGIGTRTAPYEFATGTSMSTPAVAGSAAVLASQGYEGKELAALIRSKVRIPEAGALNVRTGGVFDFNVTGSPDVDDPEVNPLAPAIDTVSVEGTTVTITGSNFGENQGSVDAFRYVVGTEPQAVTASVASWDNNEVTLELESSFVGVIKVVLTNAGDKYDTRYHFVSKGETVYEQDLPFIPATEDDAIHMQGGSFESDTGDPYIYGDGIGDWETKGPLVGLGCKLYYLPAYEGHTENAPAFKSMHCFDLKTQEWVTLPELPEWLQGVSAVMHDGTIVVEGATMYVAESGEPSATFPEGQTAEERIYRYDPQTQSWSQASSEGMYLNQTITNDSGQLKLVGGGRPDPEHPEWYWSLIPLPVMTYDLSTGAGEELCALDAVYENPQVAAKDGTILLYSDAKDAKIVRIQDGQASALEGALPKYFLAEEGEVVDGAFGNTSKYPYHAVLAPTTEGFVLVGPPADDGSSDTYVLKDGADTFETYERRSSENRVYSQAACTYRGRLFAIGSAWFEPNQRLFRATAMDVPEYPGDIPCEKDEPTPTPEPSPKPTPEPTPETKPSQAKALPKTDDPTISMPVLAAAAVCGVAAIVIGVIFRRNNRS